MVTAPAGLEAAFKTPGLRNVAMRPPYMHAGEFANLEEVVSHYASHRLRCLCTRIWRMRKARIEKGS